MKKLIFLDIDGVMNSEEYKTRVPPRRKCGWRTQWMQDAEQLLDDRACARLQMILERTGASVVISSSQRKNFALPKLMRMFKYRGLLLANRIIGATPSLEKTDEERFTRVHRGREIQTWLENADFCVGVEKDRCDDILIIDDDDDMGDWRPRLYQTDRNTGLTDGNAEACITMLME